MTSYWTWFRVITSLSLVPGFPSPALVAALRRSHVLLGGDYLVEGDPSWACPACQSRWRVWPFAWPVADDGAGAGAAAAGVAAYPGLCGGDELKLLATSSTT